MVVELYNLTTNSTMNNTTDVSAGMCQLEIILPVSIVVLILPNIIALIINLITKTKTPKALAYINIIQNLMIALIICASICAVPYPDDTLVIAGLTLCSCIEFCLFVYVHFLTVNGNQCSCVGPFTTSNESRRKQNIFAYKDAKRLGYETVEEYYKKNCFACKTDCCDGPDDALAAQREMRMLRVSREDLETAIRENEENPPTPRVTAQAYYLQGGKGTSFVTTEEQTVPIEYQSWQEENEVVRMGTKPIQIYYCRCEYVFDEELKQSIEELKSVANAKLEKRGPRTIEFVDMEMDGLVTEVVMAEDSCAEKCCRSCWCNCMCYSFMGLIGYTFPVTLWWRSQSDVLVFNSKKRMSSKRDLKANAGERLKADYDVKTERVPQSDVAKYELPLTA